jgi:K+-sensing histidine kinase KdpD
MAHALNAVSHSVAGPLQNVMNRVFTMRKRASCPDTVAALVELEGEFRSVAGRLEQLFTLPRLCASPRLQPVSLAQIADSAVTLSGADPSRVEVEMENPWVTVTVDPEQIARGLSELLINAFEASASEDKVRLIVCATEERVTFSVSDRGRGGWPSPPERSFDPLYTSKARSLGLGLPLAWRAAAGAAGAILIEPHEQGSVVTMVLAAENGRRVQ